MAGRRRDDPSVAGVLLVDKPAGATSHDVVASIRRACDIRRVGHSGTLDPAATGLLLVGVGWATRLLRFTAGHAKTYEAIVAFGTETTTWDAEGEVTFHDDMAVTRDAVEAACESFLGKIDQIPPAHSAVKIRGEKLYAKARRGERVDAPPRQVEIYDICVRDVGVDAATIEVTCSAGTYIRSLAHDLGHTLGGCAHLQALRRTKIGPHSVDDALTLGEIKSMGRAALLSPSVAVAGLDVVRADADDVPLVLAGRALPFDVGSEPTAVLAPDGALLAIYESTHRGARPVCVAPPPSA